MIRRATLILGVPVLAFTVLSIVGWFASKQDRERAKACDEFHEATRNAKNGGVPVTLELSRQMKRCAEYLATHQSGHP